jgi:hypothetical protein
MAKATRVHSTPRRTASKIQKRQEVKRPAPAEDPIFAAIENHQKLERAWLDVQAVFDEAEFDAKEKLGDRPFEFI